MDEKTTQFQMRTSMDFLRKIDDWRRKQDDLPSRAEAVRRLIELGITASEGAKLKPKTRRR